MTCMRLTMLGDRKVSDTTRLLIQVVCSMCRCRWLGNKKDDDDARPTNYVERGIAASVVGVLRTSCPNDHELQNQESKSSVSMRVIVGMTCLVIMLHL